MVTPSRRDGVRGADDEARTVTVSEDLDAMTTGGDWPRGERGGECAARVDVTVDDDETVER